jgi:hypothetical protein
MRRSSDAFINAFKELCLEDMARSNRRIQLTPTNAYTAEPCTRRIVSPF